jgi:glycosyltransferase involved in cell wall biosynthesis
MLSDLRAFSVVIPAYNAARWIASTLDSWAGQTRADFEVIVVDDGSTDQTVAIAESFQDRLDLRVVRLPHSGAPAGPCNAGIKAARGEMIAFCDADDLAAPDRLECIGRNWENAERRDCLLISDFQEIDLSGKTVRSGVLETYSALTRAGVTIGDDCTLLPAETAFTALLEGSFIRPCAAAVPKRVLDSVGGFDESLRNAQDYDLYLRIARTHPIVLYRRVLASYRITPGSISSRPPTMLAASKLAIFRRLLRLSLPQSQRVIIRRGIAANYDALAYEYGENRNLWRSINAYLHALYYDAHWLHVRGMLASLAKCFVPRQRAGY